jgi:hypothetical protein
MIEYTKMFQLQNDVVSEITKQPYLFTTFPGPMAITSNNLLPITNNNNLLPITSNNNLLPITNNNNLLPITSDEYNIFPDGILKIISQDPRIIHYNNLLSYYEERISKFPPIQMPYFISKINIK